MEEFALSEGITYLEHLVVGKADDVSRVGFVDCTLSLGHELGRRRKADCLAQTYMVVRCIALELATTNLAESYTRAVVRVDIGSNLEDETCEFFLFRLYFSFFCRSGTGGRGYADKAIQQFLDTKVVECRTEEYRCYFSREVGGNIKFRIDAVQ